jgi:hypothetical protein
MATGKGKNLTLMGSRVGAPFSAWRIAADYTVSGLTLYECNDTHRHILAKQAYTPRGVWVAFDIKAGEYFTDQRQALEIAHQRALSAAREAHEAYTKASLSARNARDARDALRAYTTQQGESNERT